MVYFLIALVLVLVAVDLFVRFVVDPFLANSRKKNKIVKSFTPKFDPTFKLATETMYDGGEKHSESETSGEENISKNDIDNSKK